MVRTKQNLTEKELKFVAAWAGNGMKAAEAAGYRYPKQHAWRLMNKPKVKQAIDDKQAAAVKATGEALGRKLTVTREEVLERLWQLAALPASETKDNISGQG